MKLFRRLLFLWMLLPEFLSAQLLVEGHVSDEFGAVESVVVSLIDTNEDVLVYRLTDKSGYFLLNYSGESDSIRLRVSLLSYKTKIISLQKNNPKLDIRLEIDEILLKEITVKPRAIYGKEDTVVYNVGAFQTQQDRSIGDVLKKLPGIQVAPSGSISHNGKEINKFYIEGLDLLAGKYGIATNNVPVGEVTQVELIENHQPVRTLKGVVVSDNSAINLKLKNKQMIRPVGTVKAGIGYDSEDWIGLLDAFALQAGQKRQTIVMLKADNAGNDITRELAEHYSMEDFSITSAAENLLSSSISVGSMSAGDNRALFNKTGIVSLNNLWKTSDDNQLRLNVNYQNDSREQFTRQTNTYFLGDSVQVLNEIKTMETGNNLLDAILTYTDNSSNRYLNNILKFRTRWINSRSDVQNQDFFSQKYDITNLNLSNSLKFTKKYGTRYWDFSSFFRYTSLPEKLVVEADAPDFDARQSIYQSGFYTNNGTFIILPFFASQVKVDLNLEAALDGLDSDLNHSLYTDSLHNNLKTGNVKMQIAPSYSYRKKAFTLDFSIPFVYHFIQVTDKQYNTNDNYKNVYFNPKLTFRYDLNAFLKMNLNYYYTHNLRGNNTDFVHSYILKDYRSLSVKESALDKSTVQMAGFNLNYKNPIKGLFFHLLGGYTERWHNQTPQQNLDGILLVGGNVQSNSQTRSWIGSGSIGKTFFDINTSISLAGNYNSMESKRIQQGLSYPLQNEVWSLRPSINTKITQHFVVQAETNYENNHLKIKRPDMETPTSSNERISQRLRFFYFPNKKIELKAAGEYCYNEISPEVSTRLYFLDIGISYKLKQIELLLNWNNIFNQNEYAYTSYTGLDTYEYSIRLRPRNLLLTATFRY
jgi:hypothetical protein